MTDIVITDARPSNLNAGIARTFFWMEADAYLHVPVAIFWTFIYPIMLFFILNLIFGGGDSPTGAHLSYADYLITGLVVMTLISTSLFSFMVVLVEQRANGNLRVFNLMPFGKCSFFLGFVTARLLILLIFCAVFTLGFSHLAPGGTGIDLSRLGGFMLYVVAGSLVLLGLSLVLAALIGRTATAHAVANIVNIPVIFLSDLFLPAAILPPAMRAVVELSPIYRFVNDARDLYAGTQTLLDAAPTIGVVVVIGAALIWFATRKFNWNLAS
jgi:ABC-2 type transport system permease protein